MQFSSLVIGQSFATFLLFVLQLQGDRVRGASDRLSRLPPDPDGASWLRPARTAQELRAPHPGGLREADHVQVSGLSGCSLRGTPSSLCCRRGSGEANDPGSAVGFVNKGWSLLQDVFTAPGAADTGTRKAR